MWSRTATSCTFFSTPKAARQKAPHLLFHMATGSGKTVLMAVLILDQYRRGYRNLLFFMNSAQIIEKTKDNFLNPASAKHLFAPSVRIDDKPVDMRPWPQQREILDAIGDDVTERVSILKSACVGATQAMVAALGYFVQNDPAPVIALVPSEEDARTFMVSNVEPVFAESPALRDDQAQDTARDMLLHRRYPGGSLMVLSARAPRNLRARTARRVIAAKGMSGFHRASLTWGASRKTRLAILGVDGLKLQIYHRLKSGATILFSDDLGPDYFDQLQAERLVTRYSRGQPVRQWDKVPGRRNEALDCLGYAIAARQLLPMDLARPTALTPRANVAESKWLAR